MKKVFLGLLSIVLVGQVSMAQPVSDMAVIPMGITIQSVMRLTITKGGNIEFVFKNASDITNGLPSTGFGTEYETTGTVTASQNWELGLTVDEAAFRGEDYDVGAGTGTSLALGVVELITTVDLAATTEIAVATPLAATVANIYQWDGGAADNLGNGLAWNIQWRCGHNAATPISGSQAAMRYAANIILTLKPDDGI